jgi:hypothetical protein
VGGLPVGSVCLCARSVAVLTCTSTPSSSSLSMASSEVGDHVHVDDEWRLGVGAAAGAVDGVDWLVRVDAADAAEIGVRVGKA